MLPPNGRKSPTHVSLAHVYITKDEALRKSARAALYAWQEVKY